MYLHVYTFMCKHIYVCAQSVSLWACLSTWMRVCVCPWKLLLWVEGRGGVWRMEIKSNSFIGLEWEQDAWATLCPLAIYFSVGVWECWTRLNILALTKQHKINTGDWGYNNTAAPSAFQLSPLWDAFWTTHKNQEINGGRAGQGILFLNNCQVGISASVW